MRDCRPRREDHFPKMPRYNDVRSGHTSMQDWVAEHRGDDSKECYFDEMLRLTGATR